VIRDTTGVFSYLVFPVWEDPDQSIQRTQGSKVKFTAQPINLDTPNKDQTASPEVLALFEEIQKAFHEEMGKLEQDSRAPETKLNIVAQEDKVKTCVLTKGVQPEVAKPLPPPDRYSQSKGGARNHLSRLFLTTVGGLASCIDSRDLNLLDATNPKLHSQLGVLDAECDFRTAFQIGLTTDTPSSQAFLDFFHGLGTGVPGEEGAIVRWANRRLRLVFTNRSIANASVDDIRIKWSERFPMDEDVMSDSAHVTIHPMPDALYLIRVTPTIAALNKGPLLDRMIVTQITLTNLLRFTCVFIALALKRLPFAPDCAQPNRTQQLASIIREFQTDNTLLSVTIP